MFSITNHRREVEPVFDRRGYYRSPVTLPSYRRGQPSATKGRKFPVEPLSAAEVHSLLAACGRGPAGRRNKALITVLWRAGLRIGEGLALYPKDVDLERGTVAVLHGKGDKSRIVGLDPEACAVVQVWMAERAKLGISSRRPLFCVISRPTAGEPIGDAYVRELCKRLAIKAGIEKRVHPHVFRHSYASYLMDRGVPLHFIRRALGHTSIAITERYCDHLNPAEVVRALRELDWPEP